MSPLDFDLAPFFDSLFFSLYSVAIKKLYPKGEKEKEREENTRTVKCNQVNVKIRTEGMFNVETKRRIHFITNGINISKLYQGCSFQFISMKELEKKAQHQHEPNQSICTPKM